MRDAEIDRRLPPDEIRRMVRLVRPDWEVVSASLVEDGVSAIYEVAASAPAGRRECYLKATQALDGPAGVGTEARVTEIVRRHTDAPVPPVLGVVDDHEQLRTPFFLTESMPGEERLRRDHPVIPAENLRSLARQTGRYVAQMHEIPLPNVDAFGRWFSHEAEPLDGDPPPGDPAELVLPDGDDEWTVWVRDWVGLGLDELAATDRFEDLVAPIEAEVEALVEQLPPAPEPVLGRVDQGLWNVLTDEECREVRAMVDFGTLVAVPPAFDLAVLEYFTAGGMWLGLPEVPDHSRAVRDGLLSGYREVRPVPEEMDRKRRLYRLDAHVFAMVSLADDEWGPRSVPRERADEAAAGLRAIARQLLGDRS